MGDVTNNVGPFFEFFLSFLRCYALDSARDLRRMLNSAWIDSFIILCIILFLTFLRTPVLLKASILMMALITY